MLAWVFEGLLYFSPHMYDCEVLFFACLFDCVFYFSSHMYDCGMLFFAAFSFLAMQRTGANLVPERCALRCRLNSSLCLVRQLRPCKKDNPDAKTYSNGCGCDNWQVANRGSIGSDWPSPVSSRGSVENCVSLYLL